MIQLHITVFVESKSQYKHVDMTSGQIWSKSLVSLLHWYYPLTFGNIFFLHFYDLSYVISTCGVSSKCCVIFTLSPLPVSVCLLSVVFREPLRYRTCVCGHVCGDVCTTTSCTLCNTLCTSLALTGKGWCRCWTWHMTDPECHCPWWRCLDWRQTSQRRFYPQTEKDIRLWY